MAIIFQTLSIGDAHIRLAVVTDPFQADLWVYRVSSIKTAHGECYWFITPDKQDATCLVYFTSAGSAQVKVYFTSNYEDAGWQNESLFRGKFG